MSGGTWDYREHQLWMLAESLREGSARGDELDDEMELPRARHWIACVLEDVADLVKGLDYHIAGDSFIENEAAWMLGASARLIETAKKAAP